MNRLAYSILALSLMGGAVSAQPMGGPDRHGPPGGPGGPPTAAYRPGGRLPKQYWGRQNEVDWHAHHLRQPPRGYHWVRNGNNYVLAAVATGLIASIIAANP